MDNKDFNKSYLMKALTDRVMQFFFWVGLGFMLIQFGVPLLADVLAGLWQSLKEYFIDAPATEQAALGFLGLF